MKFIKKLKQLKLYKVLNQFVYTMFFLPRKVRLDDLELPFPPGIP